MATKTTTPTKTADVSLSAWADIATANVTVGSAVDVSTRFAAGILVQIGRRSNSAFTAGWPNIRIEASAKSSGNDAWVPIWTYQPQVGSSIASTTLNGAVSAGATSIVVAAATNIAAGDILFLKGDTDAQNELVRVKSVSGSTVTLEEACTYAHASGNAVTDQAESVFPVLGLSAYSRIRAVVDNAGSGQTCAVQVLMTRLDSLATA